MAPNAITLLVSFSLILLRHSSIKSSYTVSSYTPAESVVRVLAMNANTVLAVHRDYQ